MLAGLAPGSVIAGYRIESRLGAGGMAVVFRALDVSLGRTVALKVLAPAMAGDGEFRERFIRESRAAAAVDHPHIIPVHAAGEAAGVLYLAMRFVPSGDLRSVARREGPLPGERAAFLLSPVASALDAAHAAGLVHRDVKPANILVDVSPGRPDHPYLSDFGLAKGSATATGLTGTGQFLGTPDFSAPEQISGKPAGPGTDQYALACVAFTILTGSLPFARAESMAVLWAHMHDPPPSVTAPRPDLPPDIDRVLARALAKNPDDRYATCGQFTDALRSALGIGSYAFAAVGFTDPVLPGAGERTGSSAVRSPSIPPGQSLAPSPAITDGAKADARRQATVSVRHGSHSTRTGRHPAARPRRRGLGSRAGIAAGAVIALGAAGAATAMLAGPGAARPHATASQSPGRKATAAASGPARPGIATLADTLPGPAHSAIVGLAFNAGGTLETASRAGLTVWNLASQTVKTSRHFGFSFSGALLSPDGTMAAVPADPGSVTTGCGSGGPNCDYLFYGGLPGGHRRGTAPDPPPNSVANESVSDTSLVTVDSVGDGTEIWGESGTLIAALTDPDAHFILGTAMSADGSVLATSSDSTKKTHSVFVWSIASKKVTATLTVPGVTADNGNVEGSAIPMAFDSDGKTLAMTDGTDTYVYDVATHGLIATVPAGLQALSPDGTLLAAIGPKGYQIWDVSTGKPVATLTIPRSARNGQAMFSFSADGKAVAMGCANGTTYVWDLSRH